MSPQALVRRNCMPVEQTRLTATLHDLVAEVARAVTKSMGTHETPSLEQTPAPILELTPQKILGINNLKQIAWIETGLKAAKSVCRILTPDGFGTGFLVADDLVMTNNHVIGSAELAAQSQIEFNYQQEQSGGFLPAVRYALPRQNYSASRSHALRHCH